MENLVHFLLRHNAFIVFMLLEAFSFYLISQNSKESGVVLASSAGALQGYVYETTNSVWKYQNLATQNKQLIEENAKLHEQLNSTYFSNKVDTMLIKNKTLEQQYTYTTATVINNSINRQNNYITIDRGTKHGIRLNTAVVSAAGVVGIVKRVSAHYAVVMSLLHHDTQISAKLLRTKYFGSVTWNGIDPTVVILRDISKNAKIKLGDSVVTSGYSSIFPTEMFIGRVKGVEIESGSNFHTVYIQLGADLGKLEHVFVVDNILRKEQEDLEKTINAEKDE